MVRTWGVWSPTGSLPHIGHKSSSRSALEIPPLAIHAEQLVHHKPPFVRHRRTALHVVAQVDVRDLLRCCLLDQAEYIPRPQAAVALVRIVETVTRRQAGGQIIHVSDADEPICEIIAPFLRRERV